MNESSIVTYDRKLIDYAAGTACLVEFNFLKIREFKLHREAGFRNGMKQNNFDPELLHFIHTHPKGSPLCSDIDYNCLKGLSLAFGFAVLFSIVVFQSEDYCELDHTIASYRFIDGKITDVSEQKLSASQLMILHLLARKN